MPVRRLVLLALALLVGGCTAGREASRLPQKVAGNSSYEAPTADSATDAAAPYPAADSAQERSVDAPHEATTEDSAKQAAGAGRPKRASVKCLITPEGTAGRCESFSHIEDTLPLDSPHRDFVVLTIYLWRYEAMLKGYPARESGPVLVDYTFHVQIHDREVSPGNSSEPETDSPEAARDREDVSKKALLLCRHEMLEAPVISRLPTGVRPSLLIRQEDIEFLDENRSWVPLTDVDRRDLHEDLAHFVWCEATEVRITEDVAVVSLKRQAPSWEKLPPHVPGVVDSFTDYGDRILALRRWVKEEATVEPPSMHQLRFVNTPKGWRADYHLPESAPSPAP